MRVANGPASKVIVDDYGESSVNISIMPVTEPPSL